MARKKTNKNLYIIIGAVLVLLIAFGFIGKQQGWIGKSKAKQVLFGKAKSVTIVEKVNASGKVQPVNEVKLSPQVPGEILDIFVEEGDSVVKGQLLLKIKPDNLVSALDRTIASLNTQKANYAQSKARLAQSRANFKKAERDFERNKGLFEQKAISQQDYDAYLASFEASEAEFKASEQNVEAARYTVLSAEATVKEARENLSFTNIYAPMGGTVTKLLVEKGETVVGTQQMAGTEMLRIADLNSMEVRVNVNENDIIRVSEGDTAVIDVDSYSHTGIKFQGIVSAIANSANEGLTGASDAVTEFEVKIRVSNDSYKELLKVDKVESPIDPSGTPFRPGMTASVDIITNRKENVLGVPLASVTTRKKKNAGEENTEKGNENNNNDQQAEEEQRKKEIEALEEVVFVHEGDSVRKVAVEIGISDFDNIQIIKGLDLDDEIVIGPYLQVSKLLNDGDKVELMEDKGKKNGFAGSN
ncbi:efflux RND transporter periplasmic adaptor subunit [Flexithrix dorotheae]|uniref:efflux RND transporter periplasmic adaptor subunit n=1 Tax=Flexithrix dorotheae TaxID=70993 RepID=UPI00037C8408|nr:efflux RND transporter periplasmic adaptor subunit [Flexithrix dorotheae]